MSLPDASTAAATTDTARLGLERLRLVRTAAQAATPEELKALKTGLSRSAQRRMSLLGLLVSKALEGQPLEANATLVYATAYAESGTLERYIDSFPEPSPLHFQAAIHPSAVEQALIERGQPLGSFMPVAGVTIERALEVARLLGTGTWLVCGEESGSWLLDSGLCRPWNVALAARIAEPDAAEAVLTYAPDTPSDPCLPWALVEALEAREDCACGSLSLRWLRRAS